MTGGSLNYSSTSKIGQVFHRLVSLWELSTVFSKYLKIGGRI